MSHRTNADERKFIGRLKGAGIIMLNYGDKRDYRKIDMFYDGEYICSTTWARTCKEAKAVLLENTGSYGHQKIVQLFGKVDPSEMVADFSKQGSVRVGLKK